MTNSCGHVIMMEASQLSHVAFSLIVPPLVMIEILKPTFGLNGPL